MRTSTTEKTVPGALGQDIRTPRASDRHFNDSPEVDISSMRQLVTEALEMRLGRIDSFRRVCKSKRRRTCLQSNKRAYYWQTLLFRQVQRANLFRTPAKAAKTRCERVASTQHYGARVTALVTDGFPSNSRTFPHVFRFLPALFSALKKTAVFLPATKRPRLAALPGGAWVTPGSIRRRSWSCGCRSSAAPRSGQPGWRCRPGRHTRPWQSCAGYAA